MMRSLRVQLVATAMVVLAWPLTGATQTTVRDGILTDAAGMTLYVYDNDLTVPGKSVCGAFCSLSWLPLLATDADRAAGEYSIIGRDDGKRQWAYKGRPLYRWINDKAPGDRTGEGFKQIWHVARP